MGLWLFSLYFTHPALPMEGREGIDIKFSVAIAKRKHPFPFRTRKLSSSAPMVLRGGLRGRVGRRRNLFKKPLSRGAFFSTIYFFLLLLNFAHQAPDPVFQAIQQGRSLDHEFTLRFLIRFHAHGLGGVRAGGDRRLCYNDDVFHLFIRT